MRPDTLPWLRQADADLTSGSLMLTGGRWYAASWFAQQAAEKALKALWIEQTGQDAVRTHDVRLLGRSVNAPRPLQPDLTTLFPVFSLTRYPDALNVAPIDAITDIDARQHIDAARRILQWVLSQL